jgi:TRAP-type C4-dicarboxylate transport system permease small subunit
MSRIINILHKVTGIASVLSLTAMMTCVVIQVISRFMLDSAPSWTEELSRMFFIYAIALGMALSFRDGSIVRLDLISRWLDKSVVYWINTGIQLAMTVFGLFVMVYAFEFFESGFRERSPALQVSMSWSFAAIPLLFFQQKHHQYRRLQKDKRRQVVY